MDLPSSSAETLDVDVVIMGGGIQGLWLLAELVDAGYQAILLERMQPGFGQTGHSHVFLHEGHMYAAILKEDAKNTDARVTAVLHANKIWKQQLQTGRLKTLRPLNSDFYIGWQDRDKADSFEDLCKRGSLRCDEVKPPWVGFGNLVKKVYKSEGVCLESQLLLDHLLGLGLSKRVGRCEIVEVETQSGAFHLLVKRDKQTFLKIRTAAAVLAAGAGNEKLELIFGPVLSGGSLITKQQTVKTFMLILRQTEGSLPLASGMYPDLGGIFLVSRVDDQGRTVWLIGDRQRNLVAVPGEITAFDGITWFRGLSLWLGQVFPDILQKPHNYQWGIYEAVKAEPLTRSRSNQPGSFPGSYHVYKEPNLPLWLTWPTLLTFAPAVTELVVSEVNAVVARKPPSSTNWNLWNTFQIPLSSDECRWKTTPILDWNEFKRCFAP